MQPRSRWDDLDFELVSALDRLDRDTSETTNLPWWLTRTGHPQVTFAIETVEDAAEAAQDAYDEKQAGKKKRPGVRRFAVPEAIDGFPLEGGLARETLLAYAAEQAERDDDVVNELGVETRRPAAGWDASAYGEFDPDA